MTTRALLGPQRLQPIVAEILETLAPEGPLAVVTAGWQEREAEVDELAEHVRRPVTNLRLHARAEEVFLARPDVFEAHRARQNRLQELQRLYRLRLGHAVAAARELLGRDGDPAMIEPERDAALEALRTLDDHHMARVAEIHHDFEHQHGARVRKALAGHRREIRAVLRRTSALAIAGGHVAVLLNRLRLFGIAGMVEELPIVAWSAGAMTLAERVVLFHDRPPQGAGHAELLDLGLGLAPGLVPLPHARARLRLEDQARVALLARRLAPAVPIALDARAWVVQDGESLSAGSEALRLATTGQLLPVEARR